MKRRATLTALAASAMVVLSGCAVAAPTPTTTTTDPVGRTTPTPTPTAAPSASRIELGPEYTRAITADGDELWRIDYDSDPAVVVTTISQTLGTPTETEHAGTPNGDYDLPATDYDWGGLRLRSPHYLGVQPRGDGLSDYWLDATASVSHGVGVVTVSGVSVGMTRDDLDPIAARFATSSADEWVHLDSWTRMKDEYEVTDWISVEIADGSVSRIFAPATSYGA